MSDGPLGHAVPLDDAQTIPRVKHYCSKPSATGSGILIDRQDASGCGDDPRIGGCGRSAVPSTGLKT